MTDWRIKDYDRFDPDGSRIDYSLGIYHYYCGDCVKYYCNGVPFASYDNDGDLLELVENPDGFKWYKKSGTTDTMATKPYRLMESPCLYKLTIAGISNNTVDQSWCTRCGELNGEYYHTSYFGVDEFGGTSRKYTGWNYDRLYTSYYINKTFYLCKLKDLELRLHPYGLSDEKYFTAPCNVSFFDFFVYLMNYSGEVQIIADAFLQTRDGYTALYFRKVLGTYDGGNCVSMGSEYVVPEFSSTSQYNDPEELFFNFGTYDGRNFSVEFTYSDIYSIRVRDRSWRVTDYSTNYLLMTGLCDFTGATFSISPYLNDDTLGRNYNPLSLPQALYGGGTQLAYCKEEHPLLSRNCGEAFPPSSNQDITGGWISQKCVATISGITGNDDSVADVDLTEVHCKKCTNINGTYTLLHNTGSITPYPATNTLYGKWNMKYGSAGLGSASDDMHLPDTCCDCPSKSTCVSDISFVFTYIQFGSTAYEIYAKGYIHQSVIPGESFDAVLATFSKYLGTVDTSKESIEILNCDNLVVELEFESQSSASYNRCDFSSASFSIEFSKYDDIQVPCYQTTPTTTLLSGQDISRYLQVDFSNCSWSWPWGSTSWIHVLDNADNCNTVYLPDCAGTQLWEGQYIVDKCHAYKNYTQSYDNDDIYDLGQRYTPPYYLHYQIFPAQNYAIWLYRYYDTIYPEDTICTQINKNRWLTVAIQYYCGDNDTICDPSNILDDSKIIITVYATTLYSTDVWRKEISVVSGDGLLFLKNPPWDRSCKRKYGTYGYIDSSILEGLTLDYVPFPSEITTMRDLYSRCCMLGTYWTGQCCYWSTPSFYRFAFSCHKYGAINGINELNCRGCYTREIVNGNIVDTQIPCSDLFDYNGGSVTLSVV